MKLPFLWLALGFGGGILLTPFMPLPSLGFWSLLVFAIPLLWFARGRKIFPPLLLLTLMTLGILHARMDRARPPHAIETFARPGHALLEGVVKSQPEVQTQGRRVKVSFALSSERLIRWTGERKESFETQGDVQVFLFQPPFIPEFGELVTLSGGLERPEPAVNPGQFDYGRYLAERNIFSIFKGYGKKSLRSFHKNKAPVVLKGLFRFRRILSHVIDSLYQGQAAVLFKALILGERKGLLPELRDEFIKTGTSHLLAISGMNIALVVGSLYLALIAMGVSQKPAALLGLLAVGVYVAIAGLGIPVQRAGWMAGAAFLSLLIERERSSMNAFFLAFFILLIGDSRVLMNVSFQLSFLSVFVLILFFQKGDEAWRWADNLFQSLAVMAGTFPLAIFYFNIFSPVSILANMGAIPLFHLALVSSFFSLPLSVIPWVGFCMARVADFFLYAGLAWIHLWTLSSWGYWFLKTPSLAQIFIYYGIFGILLFAELRLRQAPRWLRAACLSFYLVAASSFFWPMPRAGFSMTLLSAGKNELAHIHFASGHDWLVNAGRKFPSDQGQWILDPYLREKGIKHLSGILFSDLYQKHWGGLETILRNFQTDYVVYPLASKGKRGNRHDRILARVNRLVMTPGTRIRISGEEAFVILAVYQDQTIFGIERKGGHILFLTSAHPAALSQLMNQRRFLSHVRFLILGSAFQPGEKALDELFYWMDPEVVAVPNREKGLEAFLQDRDIALLDLENLGALNARFEENGNLGSAMIIESVLRGKIGEFF